MIINTLNIVVFLNSGIFHGYSFIDGVGIIQQNNRALVLYWPYLRLLRFESRENFTSMVSDAFTLMSFDNR